MEDKVQKTGAPSLARALLLGIVELASFEAGHPRVSCVGRLHFVVHRCGNYAKSYVEK